MPDWYMQIAADVAYPYIEHLARELATLFFLGFAPGIVSLIYSGPEVTT